MRKEVLIVALVATAVLISWGWSIVSEAASYAQPVELNELIDNKAIYYGSLLQVSGYVVKDQLNGGYALRGMDTIRVSGSRGLTIDEGSLDPYAAYVWNGEYRTIHATPVTVRGMLDSKGNLKVREMRFG